MILSRVKDTDITKCIDLQMEVFQYQVNYDKVLLYNRLKTAILYNIAYKITNRGKIVGYISTMNTNNNRILIDFLCVSKKFRRKGAATKLMKSVFRQRKRRTIILHTEKFNKEAIILYTKLGFVFTCIKDNQVVMEYH